MIQRLNTRAVRHLVLAASNEDGLEGLGPKFALRICKALLDGSLGVLTSNSVALAFGVGLSPPVGATPLFRPSVLRLLGSSRHPSIPLSLGCQHW